MSSLPDMRELREVHRLFQCEKSDVKLDDTQSASDEEPRVFLHLQLNSLGGVCNRLIGTRNVMVAFKNSYNDFVQVSNRADNYRE